MKEHIEIEQLLPWYVNGTLARDERAMLESHLSDCDRCQREVETLNHLAEEVKMGVPAPSTDILAKALDEIKSGGTVEMRNRAHGAKPWWRAFFNGAGLQPILAAAAVIMAAVITYQNTMVLPDMAQRLKTANQPKTLRTHLLFGTQRDAAEALHLSPEEALVLELDVPDRLNRFATCRYHLQGVGKNATIEATPPRSDSGELIRLDFRAGWPAGDYTLTLYGLGEGAPTELTTYNFSIQ